MGKKPNIRIFTCQFFLLLFQECKWNLISFSFSYILNHYEEPELIWMTEFVVLPILLINVNSIQIFFYS
jgi:hypothetical protein